MSDLRDNFPKSVVEAISKRASYICSNPECRSNTLAPSQADDSKFILTGIASHICAASPRGPRYDPTMLSEQRSSILNAIFLCATCSVMIDKNNGDDFPAKILRDWKDTHESWVTKNLNKRGSGSPSMTFNVSSHSQTGGITAGIVHIGEQRRRLNDPLRAQIRQLLPNKDENVVVQSLLNDTEADKFANEIHEFLKNDGYNVVRQQVLGVGTYPSLGFDQKKRMILVGHKE